VKPTNTAWPIIISAARPADNAVLLGVLVVYRCPSLTPGEPGVIVGQALARDPTTPEELVSAAGIAINRTVATYPIDGATDTQKVVDDVLLALAKPKGDKPS
jgi:hypothetical protein